MTAGDRAPAKLPLIGVVREAAGSYRDYWRALLIIAVVLFAPLGLIEVLSEDLRDVETDDGWVVLEAAAAGFGLAATALVGDVFYTGVVAAAVGMRRGGVRQDLAQVARQLPYLTLIAVDLLFALAVGIGLLLLVVPGVVAFTWYALAPAVVEIEHRGAREAFARSRRLVRGNFWRVLALLAPVALAGDALAAGLGALGPELVGEGQLGDWLGGVVADAATAPLFALAAVVATHHLIAGVTGPRPSP